MNFYVSAMVAVSIGVLGIVWNSRAEDRETYRQWEIENLRWRQSYLVTEGLLIVTDALEALDGMANGKRLTQEQDALLRERGEAYKEAYDEFRESLVRLGITQDELMKGANK